MKMRILAMGQDMYWLTAVHKAAASLPALVSPLKASTKPVRDPSQLPRPNNNTVLLVDASGQLNLEGLVTDLRTRGFEYVIVVAADPSAKQAISMLRGSLSYDYWEKTYDEIELRERIKKGITEILQEKELTPKSKRSTPGE
jgi:hypothetical protein